MILDRAVPFIEAIAALRRERLLPTSLTAAEIERLESSLRNELFFSARVQDSRILSTFKALLDQIVDPPTGQPGEYMDTPMFMRKARGFLGYIGYDPEPGTEGSIQDLRSDARLQLIAQTKVRMARGRGQHIQANDPDVIDAFPAQELYRLRSVEHPRGETGGDQYSAGSGYGGTYWPELWRSNGGRFYGGGRMIALKADPIWSAISRFGQPYPPFDYRSGMSVRAVNRGLAIKFGLLKPGQKADPSPVEYSTKPEADVSRVDPDLQAAVLQSLGDGYQIVDGILRAVT